MSYLLNIDKEKLNELKILAAREGTTIKKILESQVDEYIKVHKEGNPQHLLTQFTDNEDFLGFPSIAIDQSKKYDWINKYGLYKDEFNEYRFTDIGKELFGHVCQWYHKLSEY